MRRVSGVLLEGRDILLCAWLVRQAAGYLQRRDAALPAGAAELAARLDAEAGRETVAVVVSRERETANPDAAAVVVDSRHAKMTAQAAGDLIGISVQAARRMCHDGRLLARRDPAGRWAVDPGSAAAEAARRKGKQ